MGQDSETQLYPDSETQLYPDLQTGLEVELSSWAECDSAATIIMETMRDQNTITMTALTDHGMMTLEQDPEGEMWGGGGNLEELNIGHFFDKMLDESDFEKTILRMETSANRTLTLLERAGGGEVIQTVGERGGVVGGEGEPIPTKLHCEFIKLGAVAKENNANSFKPSGITSPN